MNIPGENMCEKSGGLYITKGSLWSSSALPRTRWPSVTWLTHFLTLLWPQLPTMPLRLDWVSPVGPAQ